MKSQYLDSPYPQPIDGGTTTHFDGIHEYIDYLPNTKIRLWFSDHKYTYSSHWHTSTEIIFGTSGKYMMEADGITWEVNEGDILIIPGKTVHSMDMSDDGHGFVYLIELSPLEEIPTFALVNSKLTKPIYIKKSTSPYYQTASSLLELIKNEYFSNNEYRELLVYSHILNLMTQIARNSNQELKLTYHTRSDKKREYIQQFESIMSWINQHYVEEITLESISKKFGFSRYHFSRLFSQYTNYTFSNYLTLQRLYAAENLLIHSEYSVTDIASKVGFCNSAVFSRAFKKKNLCTPTEFRAITSNQ